MKQDLEVVIIGGSYAGLSAAMTLGRALRRTLVIDAGEPCNRQTPHSHNFLTRDGATPAELATAARQQATAYPSVSFRHDRVVAASKAEAGFEITTQQGERITAQKVVLATGIKDQILPLPGFAECWGISVIHCPYCHGYEVHGRRIGLLANGDRGFDMARLIQHWNPALTLFTNGPATLTAEQQAQLRQWGVDLVETPLVALDHRNGYLQQIRLHDGTTFALTALYAQVPFSLPTHLTDGLGCTLTDLGLIQTGPGGGTSVPGLYAAGDVTTPFRSVAMAGASGNLAGAFINHELIHEKWQ
ncbi:Thioredoxin reductase [Catalinimonas alkaloidigena]|uniref:Thioredoxin reductase n=1 Tax=Catalinimonas alkaloidigena TaxID=1075417 RepID=A0A1G9RBA1_9BACT|nr:NAD(P)/FAD-dependent oxidoreductase [Catalinimonas alkaloidigena]SDM20602.1 Thioredoxin reductase [Catalinimonas alkaloidigena]